MPSLRSIAAALTLSGSLVALGGCALLVPALGPTAVQLASASLATPVGGKLSPPAWLRGTWKGERDGSAQAIIVIASEGDFQYGVMDNMTSYGNLAAVGLVAEAEKSDSRYRLTLDPARQQASSALGGLTVTRQGDAEIKLEWQQAGSTLPTSSILKKQP